MHESEIRLANKIVMETPIVKAANMDNIKQDDSLLNKRYWNQNDVNELAKILDNYIR